MMDRIASALRSLAVRGKVMRARMEARTFLQATGLDGETMTMELLLPPGYSAHPADGADVLVVQVLGQKDHLVALGGDSTGHAIADLAPGEFGLRHEPTGTQMVFRNSGTLEITAATVTVSGNLRVAGEVTRGFGGGDQVALGTHHHPVPNVAAGLATVPTAAPSAGS